MNLNNRIDATGNLTAKVWFDDWDMSGPSDGERTVTDHDFGNTFNYVGMAVNWSATYSATLMGIDFDDIEVRDGLPSEEEDITPPAAPQGLSVD